MTLYYNIVLNVLYVGLYIVYSVHFLCIRFFFKILGGAVSGFGFYAWVAYIFVGTGLALPICCAIVAGGLAMAEFSNEIAEWVSFRYDCSDCKNRDWEIIN